MKIVIDRAGMRHVALNGITFEGWEGTLPSGGKATVLVAAIILPEGCEPDDVLRLASALGQEVNFVDAATVELRVYPRSETSGHPYREGGE